MRLESAWNALDGAEATARAMPGAGASRRHQPWFRSDRCEVELQIAGLSEGHHRVAVRASGAGRSHRHYTGNRLVSGDAMNAPRDSRGGKRLIEPGRSPEAGAVEAAADPRRRSAREGRGISTAGPPPDPAPPMRIVGGRLRGLRLAPVGAGDEAARLRPTSDRVREALFNLLTNGAGGDRVTGARALDLFAGTGALGLEALSRGAAQVTFVEDGAAGRALIRRNVELAQAGGVTKLLRRDATKLGKNRGAPFGLVFLDPPYGRGLGERALLSAREGGWVAPGAVVAWEEAAPMAAPEGFAPLDARRYGETHLTLLETVAAY